MDKTTKIMIKELRMINKINQYMDIEVFYNISISYNHLSLQGNYNAELEDFLLKPFLHQVFGATSPASRKQKTFTDDLNKTQKFTTYRYETDEIYIDFVLVQS